MVLIYCLGTNNKQNDLAQKRYQSVTSFIFFMVSKYLRYTVKSHFPPVEGAEYQPGLLSKGR